MAIGNPNMAIVGHKRKQGAFGRKFHASIQFDKLGRGKGEMFVCLGIIDKIPPLPPPPLPHHFHSFPLHSRHPIYLTINRSGDAMCMGQTYN